ncbi:MAG TPA: hypothetical protein VEI04_06485 [Syntrophobacteria bacterium]|nr:hypothetical protein [Syntrophobacteria bacterium]
MRRGLGKVRGMLRAALSLFLILAYTVTCTGPGSSEKNVERTCSELSVISRKIGDNINRLDDICRQMTTIIRMNSDYHDNINIVFILEKVNLMRVIASCEQKSLDLLCHIKENYLADFCQDRLESLQRSAGLAALHIETIQNVSQKISNDAARHQLEEIIRTLRSTSDLYQRSIAVVQSLRLSK